MEQLLTFAIVGILAAVGLSIIYRFLPFRALGASKPFISFFPKYWIDISGVPEFEANLQRAGFVKSPSDQDLYLRGKMFGDISMKLVKLAVRIDREQQCATLGAPLIVIAFDAGDLWKLGQELISGKGGRPEEA